MPQIEKSRQRTWYNAGAPVNGTSGTFANQAAKGALLVDQTNATLYINVGTLASPTWQSIPSSQGGAFDGAAVANVANANQGGGIVLMHRLDIADAATNDVDIVTVHKERLLDAWLVKTGGAGAAGNTIQVKNGATAITNAMDTNVADQAVVRVGTIDDASHEIAAGGTLRVTSTKAGGNAACTVYVETIRVA